MRRHTTALALLVTALLALPGCDSDGGSGTGSGTLSATVAGAAFDAAAVQASLDSGVLGLGGSNAGNPPRQITLAVPGAQAGQTYTVGSSGVTAVWTEGTGQTDSYVASVVSGGGQITIDALSATGARGTFSFTAQNTAGQTRAVTGGTFDVEF